MARSPRKNHRKLWRGAAAVCAVGSALAFVAAARSDAGTTPADATAASAASVEPRVPAWSARRVPNLVADVAEANARRTADAAYNTRLAAALGATDACLSVQIDGRDVARFGTDRGFAPASTLKTATATVAVALLGADHRFRTRVFSSGNDLVVVGGGDPLLATDAYVAHEHGKFELRDAPFTSLNTLADAIKAAGIKQIAGAIVVDDSRHETRRYLPDWKPNYGHDGEVGALGALTVDGGFQDPVRQVPADDPAVLAGIRLAEALKARGVTVAGGVRRGNAPATAHEIAHVDSPPLRDVIREMLQGSDNYTAEELLREIAVAAHEPGTTEAGTRTVTRVLASLLGGAQPGLALHDGSGLAPDDRIACSTLLGIVALGAQPRFAAVRAGLPVAGESGTLALRFRGDPLAGHLRAKTGTLTGITGLAGVVDSGAAPEFAFLAGGPFSVAGGQDLQAKVARAVASYPLLPTVRDLVPAP